jgi:fission process protein 1
MTMASVCMLLLASLPASALVAKAALPRASIAARRSAPALSMVFDAAVIETVASAALAPGVFVGTGAYLIGKGGEEEAEAEAEAGDGEVDLYRDTLLRYAGYANEVGEAFAPLVPPIVVPASYAVAITYVVADTVDKTRKAYGGNKYEADMLTKCALIEGLDALIWQLAASVALPGYTIHQVVLIAVTLFGAAGLTEGVYDVVPTAIGLATIPLVVKPLDELAEVGMDVTLRKLWGPYLESCEVKY